MHDIATRPRLASEQVGTEDLPGSMCRHLGFLPPVLVWAAKLSIRPDTGPGAVFASVDWVDSGSSLT